MKEWLVQLRNLNEKQVHSPFETLSKSEFEKTGYWKPIVIHQEARDRTLNTFKRALGKEYTRNAMN